MDQRKSKVHPNYFGCAFIFSHIYQNFNRKELKLVNLDLY